MSEQIKEFVKQKYDLEALNIKKLEGYGSENYKVEAEDQNFTLKFYNPDEEPYTKEILEAENLLLQRLTTDDKTSFPVPQKDSEGKYLSYSQVQNKLYRLLTFIEGEMLADVEHTPELFYSFGKFVAQMNKQISDFRNISTEARKFVWDLQYLELNRKFIKFIDDPSEKKLVEYFFLQFKENVEPKLESLRKRVIHGDANDWNVLVEDGKVSGIIDFGDITYSPLINELAIAVAYAIFGKDDFTKWAIPIIKGYHEILPLEEEEIELLYYLIAARACVSVCNGANKIHEETDSEYVIVSLKPAWDLLRRWIRLNPLKFEDEIRKEIGFKPKITDETEKDLAKRNQHTSKALSLQFDEPIKMVGSAFQYMYSADGTTYLDCYNNIPQVGHCHPQVVKAGQRAIAKLNTNSRYLNEVYNEYAQNLAAKFPETLRKVFFVNSGSAASDLAIRLALAHTQNKGIVVMEHGYHGNTRLGIDISHYKYNRKGGSGKHASIIEAEIPDTYKGRFQNNEGTAGQEYANSTIEKIKENAMPIAAFIAEPVVGCGGQIPLAKDYLKNIYPFIQEQSGVCISDEVQTGFGRLGKYFWGFEMQEVVPDIVIMGKPIGNGHPMAAVITTDEIAESFETGMEFFSSFGGNPVSCAIGQAVLNVLEEEKLPENAEKVGGYLLKRFKDLVDKYEVCGDARGEGLFLGLEFVTDEESKEPNTKLASHVQNKLKERNIMVGTDGPMVNVIKVKPPICFTKENADELVNGIDEILQSI